VYFWAWKNNIPVFCPAITDGSIGAALALRRLGAAGAAAPGTRTSGWPAARWRLPDAVFAAAAAASPHPPPPHTTLHRRHALLPQLQEPRAGGGRGGRHPRHQRLRHARSAAQDRHDHPGRRCVAPRRLPGPVHGWCRCTPSHTHTAAMPPLPWPLLHASCRMRCPFALQACPSTT
jgi:hypothetical protein